MKNALIVGAGIAGCSAALALSRAGWNVSLLEKQERWSFESSGIFVYANGLQQFARLGVMDEMVEAGFVVPEGRNVYLDALGAPLATTRYPGIGDAPAILGIKRAEMYRVLSRRIEAAGIAIELGTTVRSLIDAGEHVEVVDSRGRTSRVDLVVGADGIRSSIRGMLWPDVQPTYTGFGVWRSVHRRPPSLVDKYMLMGPGQRLGIMPISKDLLYIFGTVREPAGQWYDRADWPRLMTEKFAAFGGPVRPFLDEIADGRANELLYTAVEEVSMPGRWHRGRTILIGDAAHASTPFMGQGGAMAVQDAVELGEALSRSVALEEALSGFTARRAPMCSFVQEVSRRVGESGANASAHDENLRKLKADGQAAVDGFYDRLQSLS